MNIISNKWVFRVKYNANGDVDKFKARLVARGFEQTAGVDFHETFSPVIKPCTIRLIFTLVVTNQWSIQQIDVNNAFLNGDLKETVYMSQPEGFADSLHPTYVCKLQKALYGLKQAPRAWFLKLTGFLSSIGFKQSVADSSLFYESSNGAQMFILIYVDDIRSFGGDSKQISSVIQLLNDQFALKTLGEVDYFLGMEAHRSAAGLVLSQSKYIHDFLVKIHMLDCKPSLTPISTGHKLSLKDNKEFDQPSLYRSVVGTLQYLTFTRPDIAFTINKLSQFLHQPTMHHWLTCKHLLRYLRGTMSLGIMFKPAARMLLEAYSDADWASSVDDRKSTVDIVCFLVVIC
ncbi:hypothetical protein DH2020_034596 [Rehmannia glutinosa]|uniref:Reverse transcriptase Ty1/copia-type domain-containing protein n=1 Tax=Rehmannia glutinosa TaxID=99300 RepID=A0ABR0V8N9_REHGL